MPNSDGTTRVTVRLDAKQRRLLDLCAMALDKTIQDCMVQALAEFADRNRPQIRKQLELMSDAYESLESDDG